MKAFRQAFIITRQSIGMVAGLYSINAGLSLLILFPAYATLTAETGDSMAFTNLLPGFDYTVFSDFLAISGKAVNPLMSVGKWLGVIWIIVSLFLTGGILLRFAQPERPVLASEFLTACAHYMGRVTRLTAVILLFAGVLVIIVLLVGTLVAAGLYNSVSEQILFYVGLITLAGAVLMGAFIFCIGDYAKVKQFRDNDPSSFRAFGQAGRFVLANIGQTFGPYLLLMLLGTALFGVYFLLEDLIGTTNRPTILLMFVVQQAFILSRVFLKVWSLGTAYGNGKAFFGPVAPPALHPLDELPKLLPTVLPPPVQPNLDVLINSPVGDGL